MIKKFTLRFDNKELHQDFKIKCIKNNTSMQSKIIEMIKNHLLEPET